LTSGSEREGEDRQARRGKSVLLCCRGGSAELTIKRGQTSRLSVKDFTVVVEGEQRKEEEKKKRVFSFSQGFRGGMEIRGRPT
jgi:hypothetical protein